MLIFLPLSNLPSSLNYLDIFLLTPLKSAQKSILYPIKPLNPSFQKFLQLFPTFTKTNLSIYIVYQYLSSSHIGGQCNIMMSSQLTSLLQHYCENIINDLPHSSDQLQRIIQLFSSSNLMENIIVRLVALFLRINYSEIQDPQKRREVGNELIAQILQLIVPLMNANIPLKFLMARNFTKFILFCQQQIQDKDFKELSFRTQGLFPLNDTNGIGSIFSFHSQKRQVCQGNPNWLFSRYLLANWYKLKKEQMSVQVQQVYSFILSEPEFCSRANNLTKVWALLYAFYTQSILEQDLSKEVPVDSRYITWKRFEQNQFVEEILAIQSSLPQEHKVLYHLVCCLLNQLKMGTKKGIKEVYQLLGQYSFQNLQLKIFISVLFLQISRIQKNSQLENFIKTQGKKLIDKESSDSAIFFSLFFNFEELINKLTQKQANFSEIPLKPAQKCEFATQLYTHQKLTKTYLHYLSNQFFLEMFSSNKWQEQGYAQFVLSLMSDNKKLFIEKLMVLAEQSEPRLAAQQFQLFFNAWNSCYRNDLSSLELTALQKAGLLGKFQFRKKYQFVVVPLMFPEVVLKIMLDCSRFFSINKEKMNGNSKFQKLLNLFQDVWIPKLINKLDQDQRTLFWKEWIGVVNGDRQFVEEMLRAADHKIDN